MIETFAPSLFRAAGVFEVSWIFSNSATKKLVSREIVMKTNAPFFILLVLTVGCTISLGEKGLEITYGEKGLTEGITNIPEMESTLWEIVPTGTTVVRTCELMEEHGFECLDFIKFFNENDSKNEKRLDCIRYDSVDDKRDDHPGNNMTRVWFVSFPIRGEQVGLASVSMYYKTY